ncbi:hypothetical protein BC938DRAFT_479156 [Jimgerdemannia flammicorona]|uniref:Uncharacterized protein n=1 Tax=Jimgerdemannia flammicorona TaxID=994334 RepID=A0A433QY09_9FUNG|nr:hypothetical protein BC938DRAFT_479156 [Jimgerdemannia flammicorona]
MSSLQETLSTTLGENFLNEPFESYDLREFYSEISLAQSRRRPTSPIPPAADTANAGASSEPMSTTLANTSSAPLTNPSSAPLANFLSAPLANPSSTPLANPLSVPLANPSSVSLVNPSSVSLANPSSFSLANPSSTPLAKLSPTPPAKFSSTPQAKLSSTPLAKLLPAPLANPSPAPPANPSSRSKPEALRYIPYEHGHRRTINITEPKSPKACEVCRKAHRRCNGKQANCENKV